MLITVASLAASLGAADVATISLPAASARKAVANSAALW
jgi:hypothetical protein